MTFVSNLSLNIKHLSYVAIQRTRCICNASELQQRTTTTHGTAHLTVLLNTEHNGTQHHQKAFSKSYNLMQMDPQQNSEIQLLKNIQADVITIQETKHKTVLTSRGGLAN